MNVYSIQIMGVICIYAVSSLLLSVYSRVLQITVCQLTRSWNSELNSEEFKAWWGKKNREVQSHLSTKVDLQKTEHVRLLLAVWAEEHRLHWPLMSLFSWQRCTGGEVLAQSQPPVWSSARSSVTQPALIINEWGASFSTLATEYSSMH